MNKSKVMRETKPLSTAQILFRMSKRRDELDDVQRELRTIEQALRDRTQDLNDEIEILEREYRRKKKITEAALFNKSMQDENQHLAKAVSAAYKVLIATKVEQGTSFTKIAGQLGMDEPNVRKLYRIFVNNLSAIDAKMRRELEKVA